jgi:hypothetical protein
MIGKTVNEPPPLQLASMNLVNRSCFIAIPSSAITLQARSNKRL